MILFMLFDLFTLDILLDKDIPAGVKIQFTYALHLFSPF